jgi:hypothetical protein
MFRINTYKKQGEGGYAGQREQRPICMLPSDCPTI